MAFFDNFPDEDQDALDADARQKILAAIASGRGRPPVLGRPAQSSSQPVNPDSGDVFGRPSESPRLLGLGSQPKIPPMSTTAPTEEPSILRNFGGDSGAGSLSGMQPRPTRPNVLPTREDFPVKPVPTWEKVLGVAAAPFLPNVTQSIFQGPQRRADAQYKGAVEDYERGISDEAKQAQTEETKARTRALNNPPPKQGVTPEETTIADLMTGDGGKPRINPDTQKPYTQSEAYRAVQQMKAGAAQGAKQPLLDPATVSQINDMHTQRYQVLNPNKPLPPAMTLRPGSTQADYDRIDKNLTQMESAQGTETQREANNAFRNQQAADAADRREQARQDRADKDAAKQVFAYDPKSKQRVLMSAGEAKAQGLRSYTEVKQPDIEKETSLNSQMNDMQLNTSRYRAALNAMGPLSDSDRGAMTRILSDKDISGYITNELTLGALMDQIGQGEKGKAWNKLSPDKQDSLIGYLRMKNTGLLAQKVLTGMGRASKEALDIELSNMPSPIEGATVGNKKLDAWQDNLDQINSRSVKLPWMETPADVRARVEGQATQQYNQRQQGRAPTQPQPAAPKPLKKRLVDFLNQKMGAE